MMRILYARVSHQQPPYNNTTNTKMSLMTTQTMRAEWLRKTLKTMTGSKTKSLPPMMILSRVSGSGDLTKPYRRHQTPLQPGFLPGFEGNINWPIKGALKLAQSGSNVSFTIEFNCHQMRGILKGAAGLSGLPSPCPLPTADKTSHPRAQWQQAAFTPAEDAELRELDGDTSLSWKERAERFPSRAKGTLRTRYNLITQPTPLVMPLKRKR